MEDGADVAGIALSGRARRLSHLFTVDDRLCVCSLLFSTLRTCTCVLGFDL